MLEVAVAQSVEIDSEDALEGIFNEFQQADSSITQDAPDSGWA